MKLKLDEKALNAYINRAINEELTELYCQEEFSDKNEQNQTNNLDIHRILVNKYEIARFQTWFNLSPEEGGMGGKLVVDGIIGPKTIGAWNQWLAQRNI